MIAYRTELEGVLTITLCLLGTLPIGLLCMKLGLTLELATAVSFLPVAWSALRLWVEE